MSSKKKGIVLNEWWKQFLTSILGTAIGLGLTFSVDKCVDNHKKEEAQRLTAMMVIYDIDKSIETVRNIKEHESQGFQLTQYVMERLERIDSIHVDTLNQILQYISDGLGYDTSLEFSESSEKMFHSTQDAWMNLDDVSFIRNVEDFYKTRATFKKALQDYAYWKKPVSKAETEDGLTNTDIFYGSWQAFTAFLRSKLESQRCSNYLRNYFFRVQQYNSIIELWTESNEANKFLMNITDDELKEFAEKTTRHSHPAQEKEIVGKWVYAATDDHSTTYDYRHDHTFTHSEIHKLAHALYRGKAVVTLSVDGTWKTEGDSLVIVYHPATCHIEVNEDSVSYPEAMRDSVHRYFLSETGEEKLKAVKADISKHGGRRARATNIDLTSNRLKLTTPDNETTHYKRMK